MEQTSSTSSLVTQWPDFYQILRLPIEAPAEEIRHSISELYAAANLGSDHRDLSTRFYNQVLSQKLLPLCRRILLDPQKRAAYDEQLLLHRAGSGSVSYSEFIMEVTHTKTVSSSFKLSDAELAILPTLASAPGPNGLADFGATTQTQTTTESQKVVMRVPLTPPLNAAVPAPPLDNLEVDDTSAMPQHAALQNPATPRASVRPAPPETLATTAPPQTVAAADASSRAGKPALPIAALPIAALAVAGVLLLGTAGWFFTRNSASNTNDAALPAAGGAAADGAAAGAGNLVANGDFEPQSGDPWKITGKGTFPETAAFKDAKHGQRHLSWYLPKEIAVGRATQQLNSLPNGLYTLSAWTRQHGPGTEGYMFVSTNDTKRVILPATQYWSKVTIKDVRVADGNCIIGFYGSVAPKKKLEVDVVEFRAQ